MAGIESLVEAKKKWVQEQHFRAKPCNRRSRQANITVSPSSEHKRTLFLPPLTFSPIQHYRVATLQAVNSTLKSENEHLRAQLSIASSGAPATDQEIAELTEEFSRRLGAADKTIAALQNEKEDLRHQFKACSSLESLLKEKELYIQSLYEEGGKLSIENSKLETIIKQLRAQLVELESNKEALQIASEQEEELHVKVEELQAELNEAESSAADREASLRSENIALEKRLRDLECAMQSSQRDSSDTTKPLLRQIEAMAESAKQVESELHARLSHSEAERERLSSDISNIEIEKFKVEKVVVELQKQTLLYEGEIDTLKIEIAVLKKDLKNKASEGAKEREQLQVKCNQLQHDLDEAKLNMIGEQARVQELQELLWNAGEQLREVNSNNKEEEEEEEEVERNSKQRDGNSNKGIVAGLELQQEKREEKEEEEEEEEEEDHNALSLPSLPSPTTLHTIPAPNASSLFAKKRLELAEQANAQLLTALSSSEKKASMVPRLETALKEYQYRLSLALELLGERNERIQELEEDVGEMKRIFHQQLEQALSVGGRKKGKS
jgi:TATA element modulatory factor